MVDLIRNEVTTPTKHINAMMPEMRVIRAVGCLTNRKKQWSSDGFDLSQPSIKRVITQAIAAHYKYHFVNAVCFICSMDKNIS